MVLENASHPTWHAREGGWGVWSFELGTPVYYFMLKMNRAWAGGQNLAGRLLAIRPFVPKPVFQRAVIYATLNFAKYVPPLQFREDLVVEVKDGEAFVLLPDPTNLSLIVPAPESPARLLHLFLNYPVARDEPVRVLSVWTPLDRWASLIRSVAGALPKGSPDAAIGKLARLLANTHPEDLGVIGPWSYHTLGAYLAYIANALNDMDRDAILASVAKYTKLDEG